MKVLNDMTDNASPPDRNIRGPLLLLLADMACWKCSAMTRVGALAGQADTEAWQDEVDPPRWLQFEDPTTVTRVTAMSPNIETAVVGHLSTLRPTFSQTADMGYWMNHCTHCGAGTGDFYTHAPDGPFFAWPRAKREGITVVELGSGELSAEPPYLSPPETRTRRRVSRKKHEPEPQG